MSHYIKLYYGYKEDDYGISHAFVTSNITGKEDDLAIAKELANSLDCFFEDDNFNFDSSLIAIPEEVVEWIKEIAVTEYKQGLEQRLRDWANGHKDNAYKYEIES